MMASGEVRIPSVSISLKRLYRLYLSKGSLGAKEKRYLKAVEVYTGGFEEGLGFEAFRERLLRRILEELRVQKALDLLWEERLPLSPGNLAWALSKVGVRAGVTASRTLIGLLRAAGALQVRGLPVVTKDPEEAVYEYVLSRSPVKYGELERRFGNAKELVLSLAKKGKVCVKVKGVALSLSGVEDWDDVAGNVPEEFVEEWTGSDGVVRRKIVIPGDAVVYAALG